MPPRAISPVSSYPGTRMIEPARCRDAAGDSPSSWSDSPFQAQAGQRPFSRLCGRAAPQAGQCRRAFTLNVLTFISGILERRFLRNVQIIAFIHEHLLEIAHLFINLVWS